MWPIPRNQYKISFLLQTVARGYQFKGNTISGFIRSFYRGTAKVQIPLCGKHHENQCTGWRWDMSPWFIEAILLFHTSHPISFTLVDRELQRKWSVPVEWFVFPYLLSRNKQTGKAIPEFNLLQFILKPHLHSSILLPSHPNRRNEQFGSLMHRTQYTLTANPKACVIIVWWCSCCAFVCAGRHGAICTLLTL